MKKLGMILTIVMLTIYNVNFAWAQVVEMAVPDSQPPMHVVHSAPMQVDSAQLIAPRGAMVSPGVLVDKGDEPTDFSEIFNRVGTMVKVTWWIEIVSKVIIGLLGILGIVLAAFKGKEWRQALKTKRIEKIHRYADTLFPVIEDIAKTTEWKGDDKLVELLKRIDTWLFVGGESPMNEHEVDMVKGKVADMALADKAYRFDDNEEDTEIKE